MSAHAVCWLKKIVTQRLTCRTGNSVAKQQKTDLKLNRDSVFILINYCLHKLLIEFQFCYVVIWDSFIVQYPSQIGLLSTTARDYKLPYLKWMYLIHVQRSICTIITLIRHLERCSDADFLDLNLSSFTSTRKEHSYVNGGGGVKHRLENRWCGTCLVDFKLDFNLENRHRQHLSTYIKICTF